MELLTKTLDQMNLEFSSNEFSRQALKNGLSKRTIDKGIMRDFLVRNCHRGDTKRMWVKKYNTHTIEWKTPIHDSVVNDPIQDAIELLKSKGYRVMKPVSEWVEI